MCSILVGCSHFAKNRYCTNTGLITKILPNLRGNDTPHNELYHPNQCKIVKFSYFENHPGVSKKSYCTHKRNITRAFSNLKIRHDFSQRVRYMHTDLALKPFAKFRTHADFSKKLSSLDRNKTEDICNIVKEWLLRFHSLDGAEFNVVSGTFSTFSKLDIFGKKWTREDRELFTTLIIRLTAEGNELLCSKNLYGNMLGPWHIALCLNAISKWNVLKSNEWEGTVDIGDDKIHKIYLFKSFISRLIYHGNQLINPKNGNLRKFNSQDITNSLNALSQWNLDEFEGSKEFIFQLVKRGNLIVNEFDPVHVSITLKALSRWNIDEIQGAREFFIQLTNRGKTIFSGKTSYLCTSPNIVGILNAMSKWDIEELQHSTEFIIHLMRKGISLIDEFTAIDVSNSLNALAKWNIDELPEAKGFIVLLIKQGGLRIDRFESQNIANSLNALSKWNIDELLGAREFIVRLVKRGSAIAGGFNSQEIANSLNALSKWNIDELDGSTDFIVQLVRCGYLSADTFKSKHISSSLNALSKWNIDRIEDAEKFIVRLISRGYKTSEGFNSQAIANSLNALSKWNIDQITEAKNFIAQLVKRGCSNVDVFRPLEIVNALNALSKWNVEEFQGAKEFISSLIKRGIAKIDSFNSQSIANSLNALSKWDINWFDGADKFIIKLIERGSSLVDTFDPQGIANCLNAISQWNFDELQGSKEFVVQLAKQGIVVSDKFTSIDIAGSLNSLHQFNVFDGKDWNDDQLKIIQNFIIELTKKGEKIREEFNSPSTALSLHAFSTFHIFDEDRWSKSEQEQLKNFFISLSNVNSAFKNFTLENIYRTYNLLSKWSIFHNHAFSPNEISKFEGLISNLENRIFTIAKEYDSKEPEVDIQIATQFIKDLSVLKSKKLIESENHLLVSLVRCLSIAVDKCASSRLKHHSLQNHVVCGLQYLYTVVNDLEDKSSLKGSFDENLTVVFNKLAESGSNRIDEVSEIINQFDKLGMIRDRKSIHV